MIVLWGVIGIILLTSLFVYLDVFPLLRKKDKKELIVFTLFVVPSVVITICYILDLKIPNPLNAIINIFEPISRAFQKW